VAQSLLKNSHTLPNNEAITVQFNDSSLMQFHFHGLLLTIKTRVEFIGDPPGNNCKRRYVDIYRLPRKALLRNDSIVCNIAYWTDAPHHKQMLNVILTNGDAALDVKGVVIYIRVEVSDSLPVQNYLYNVTMLKPQSLSSTHEVITETTPSNQGFVDSFRSNATTQALLVVTVLLTAALVVISVAFAFSIWRANKPKSKAQVQQL